MSLLGVIAKEAGCFFENVDKRGGLNALKDKFLKEAAKAAKGKTAEEASVIGWNKCCDYDKIYVRYHESYSLWLDRHPPVNY
jgi:hypothetical protein